MADKLTKPFAKYPHFRSAGSLVFLAGQGSRDPETNAYAGLTLGEDGGVLDYDIAAQTQAVLKNMERALASAGLSIKELVDVTVFLKSMDDFETMNMVWNDYFGEKSSPPTRTTVAVSDLPGHNFVEMKGIASTAKGDRHGT